MKDYAHKNSLSHVSRKSARQQADMFHAHLCVMSHGIFQQELYYYVACLLSQYYKKACKILLKRTFKHSHGESVAWNFSSRVLMECCGSSGSLHQMELYL